MTLEQLIHAVGINIPVDHELYLQLIKLLDQEQ
jgi:hypothetical protein